MEFLDARRLTGPSLLFDGPGAILDVRCNQDEARGLIPVWRKHVEHMLSQLGWEGCEFQSLLLSGGVSLGFTSAIDALYAASELNEWAYAASDAEINGAEQPDFEASLAALRAAIAEEANPELIELEALAAERGVTFLWDDDEASLGLGRHSQTWPVRELPDPGTLEWGAFRDVPSGLVTGTNGKTTTVRLAAHIIRAGGHNVGFSSTDFIAVNDRIVDRDDWSGPGGARNVLRENEVDVAILETARGGLLRRGLGTNKADAALITNIAKDHLGDFGSQNLDELLQCKWIVTRAVSDDGKLVLNADDPLLVKKSAEFKGDLVWFSMDEDNVVVREHTSHGGVAFVLDGQDLLIADGDVRTLICHDHQIPIALGGAARHNVANSLAAARCNVYQVNGYTVIVVFAHNPEALQALLAMAGRVATKRKALCFGQAGDRPDDLIRELARSAWESGLDQIFVSELARYHRGREAGEVFAVIKDELIDCGADARQIEHHDEEIESLNSALEWAEPGDLIIMLALERSPELHERLESMRTDDDSNDKRHL
jgi:UDP-N-acetylmuramyl tripeptide synthase